MARETLPLLMRLPFEYDNDYIYIYISMIGATPGKKQHIGRKQWCLYVSIIYISGLSLDLHRVIISTNGLKFWHPGNSLYPVQISFESNVRCTPNFNGLLKRSIHPLFGRHFPCYVWHPLVCMGMLIAIQKERTKGNILRRFMKIVCRNC